MKKIFICGCVAVFITALYFGLRQRLPFLDMSNRPKELYTIQKRLQTFHPVQEQQDFVVIILGENGSNYCERQLKSIFEQTHNSYHVVYLDHSFSNQNGEKVKQICKDMNKEDKLTLVSHKTQKNKMEAIYGAIQKLKPHQIVVYLEGDDWLAHENVFDHLNAAYAHPDVWLTYSRTIHHPDYQKIEGQPYSDQFLKNKKFREKGGLPFDSLVTFPVAYFKEIRLQDLLFNGKFLEGKIAHAFLYPLMEMGPEHLLFIDEVMLVKNSERSFEDHKERLYQLREIESHLSSLKTYSNLSFLNLRPLTSSYRRTADVLIFSEDSPLHLYACLESLHLKVQDVNQIYVIYQSHDHEFGRAYLNLKSEFPSVQFMDVCDYPGNDFKTLLTKALLNQRNGSPYILMTHDHFIFDQKIQLDECIETLEKVHADHFFLSLDEKSLSEPLPETICIGDNIYVWQIGEKGSSQSPYMCICRKAILEEGLDLSDLKDLYGFNQFWKKQLRSHGVALFYEEKKTLPLKLDHEENLTQKRDWKHKFIEGYKIDLPSLLCEMDEVQKGDYPLIKREKCKLKIR